ncbi:hypothetical protein [Niastella vici]|uniref:hypothetical protein n=1 Tax=Niastella vici TaxID=1703345 RepID=UPI0009BF1670|nr:hypothetical protein [Niastella vici]
MKIISTLFISCLLYFTATSQPVKLFGNYSLSLPQQQMASNIQAIHSLHIGGLYQLPGQLKNLNVGLEFGIGMYAHKKIDQTFNFDANTSTVVPVNYNSNVFNFNLQTRYMFLDETKHLIVPYFTAKAGVYDFFSNIYIEDPSDPDGCHPLDKKNLISDKALYWGAGVGFQVDPSLFSKHKKDLPVKFDVSVNTIRGGKLDYINTKDLKDEQDVPSTNGKPLLVKFINVGTQDIHEHKVAQVYTSPLRLIEIKAGLLFRLGNW